MRKEHESSFQWYMRVYKSLRHSHSVSAVKRGVRTMYMAIAKDTKKRTEQDLRKLIEYTVDEFEDKTGIEVADDFVSDIISTVIMGKLYKEKWTLDKAVKGIDEKTQAIIDGIIESGQRQGKTDAEIVQDILPVINPNDSQYQHTFTTDSVCAKDRRCY